MTKKRKKQAAEQEETSKKRPEDQIENPNALRPLSDESTFPIVGIGASAGGLEAFEMFFKHMPHGNGMAFILVQHLDPTRESILVELIKRCTPMDVYQVADGMKIHPDCVYIIPPNHDMALMHGKLHLMEPAKPVGFRLPIDFLFRSMAEDLAEKAICIVLSGTGSDGTLGLREVHSAGGLTMVQSSESAKYDGMPRSAIATGVIDYILTPDNMPHLLIDYCKRSHDIGYRSPIPSLPEKTAALEKVFILLRSKTKHDFSYYKRNTIVRRIARRMVLNKIEQLDDYVSYLRNTPGEVETLFRELLIGVTSFFRDKDAFDALNQHAIPTIIANRIPDNPIRIWVAGCSTGEEAYSIAMLIREQMTLINQEFEVQIFATDIDNQAIEKARMGRYPSRIALEVSPERLQRFFIKDGDDYQITQQIREMIVFAVHSIIKDPPFSKIDLISCRNLLIYFGPELQSKVIPLFHYALKPGGYLFLGTSESLSNFDRFFVAIARQEKLFQRIIGEAIPQQNLDFTGKLTTNYENIPLSSNKVDKSLNIRQITETVLLKDYTPSAVIIDNQNTIIFFHGETSDYLTPKTGEASLNLLQMARDGLRIPLSNATYSSIAQDREISHQNINIHIGELSHTINITVKPISESPTMQKLFLVVFEDVMTSSRESDSSSLDVIDARDQQLIDLERELQSVREYLQSTVEELETANEELKSTNEELQSSNEELQSANEELETAKEELQSVNEEIITVNSELQSKIDDLTISNNDLTNLLASVDVGIIFLDNNLNILRFNASVSKLINLIPSDVGRPINHIVSNMDYSDLFHDANKVLDTLIPREIEVQMHDGSWYWMRIRPYRTTDNVIDGVVLTFGDITAQKQTEANLIKYQAEYDRLTTVHHTELQNSAIKREAIITELREFQYNFQLAITNSHTVIFEQDLDLHYTKLFNPAPEFTVEQVIGKTDEELLGLAEATRLTNIKRSVIETGVSAHEIVKITNNNISSYYDLFVDPIADESGEIIGILCSSMDITERWTMARKYVENIVATIREPLLILDNEIRIVLASASFYKMFQVNPEDTEGQVIYEIGNNEWDNTDLRKLLGQILTNNILFKDFEIQQDFETLGKRTMLLNARQLITVSGLDPLILLGIEDITDRE